MNARTLAGLAVAAALSLVSHPAGAQTEPSTAPQAGATAPQTEPSTTQTEATAAAPRAAATARAAPVAVDLTVGARLVDVNGSRERFEEFGTVGDGLVIDSLRLQGPGPTGADFVELELENAIQDDESYRLTVGRQGRYRLDVTYDGMPHRFAPGTFLWGGVGTGRLQIPDVVQQQLQANEQTAAERGFPATDPVNDTSGEDAIQQGIVRGLYSAADRVRLGTDRRRAGAGLELDLSRDASAWVRVHNENRDGARALGTGSYERWNEGTGLTHVQDRFMVLGAEVAEPYDDRTFGVELGAGLHKAGWIADVEYAFTQFRNFEDVLLWDNPFRIADVAQTGGFNRSGFAVGQVVLPPDSLSHELTATGAFDIPLHGRVAVSASYGMVTQDDPFFPYTRNTAIDTDAVAAGVQSAATLALPARDLNGDVRTIAGTLSASIRPIPPIGVTATYRAYRYDGRSSVITFPGYAAFGESGWRTERNDVTAGQDAPVRNEVFDYWRHDADLGADVRLTRILSVSADVSAELWRFHDLRLDSLDEYSAGAGFAVKPARNTSFGARYRYADRTNGGYLRGATAENPEARGLLNYNWSDRRRHLADARAQYAPSRLVSFGVLARLVNDRYGGETEEEAFIDRFRFGRTDLTRWIGSLDVGVNPSERLSLQATYTLERRNEGMSLAAKDDPVKATDDFGIGDNFARENYWDSDVDERVHSVGLTASIQVLPGSVVLDAGYTLSLSDVDVDTNNPNGVTATLEDRTLLNAVANDWPTITTRLHEVFADLGYQVSPGIRAGVRYLYSAYDLGDFAWDQMEPYMAGRSVENSTRYLFADANDGGYDAHVGTAYVAGSF